MNCKPELIAPAGNMECARAAVANGANAVYFGLPSFNARMRADNFTLEQLPELVRFLHQHDVRAFTTFNTLIFTKELDEAEKLLILLDQAGVDVVIVQDLGLARLARDLGLKISVHGSTQMTITSPEGIQFVQRLGLQRVVLARELSLRELSKFGETKMPLEVFVHGALCVAYSGQCLTSEALGQRSANRGECAQACRLPYGLIVDGVLKDLGDKRYLLSPQDLAAIHEIPELIASGVTGFKIEGRLKTPEYVAATTRAYRQAIDAACAGNRAPVSAETSYELEMAFSRGLFSGWMHGVNHQKLVHARYGKKRGAFVGLISQVGRDFVEVDSKCALRCGDGIVFDIGGDTDQEQGGRIYEIREKKLFFKNDLIDFSKLSVGHRVWKTSDPSLEKALRKTFEGDIPEPKTPICFILKGSEGKPLVMEVSLNHKKFSVESELPLQKALKRPFTTEYLNEQLGRLGNTPYVLSAIENQLVGEVMLPVSELNRVRRALMEKIEAQQTARLDARTRVEPILKKIQERIKRGSSGSQLSATQDSPSPSSTELVVLCRSMEQIQAALDSGIKTIYADFEDIRRYSEAVGVVRKISGAKILLATPRIQKAGEQGFFKLIENAAPDGVLIRNLGGLAYFKETSLERIGDFSLNVANPLTAELLIQEGLKRVTISYDLNAQQVMDLLEAAPAHWFELTLHQHMPLFHMEHCVFAAFLSEGTDHTNCGRPCDHHRVKLRDRVGIEHPLKADVGCRNTVFHAKAQSGARFLESFLANGVSVFRIELLEEDASMVAKIIAGYRKLLQREGDVEGFIQEIKAVGQLGVTSGTLTVLQ